MKKFYVSVFAAFCLLVFAGVAFAEQTVTPTSLEGTTVVEAEWVKANYKRYFVADVRKKAEYVEGHIAGAVSIPYDEKSEKAVNYDQSKDSLNVGKFPPGKQSAIIVYCNGEHCWKSFKASKWLIKEGYTNVYWFRDGYPLWRSKGYPVE